MRSISATMRAALLAAGLLALTCPEARAENWVFYAGSAKPANKEQTLIDWYQTNSLKPVPEDKAAIRHYYDEESVAANSPFGGGTVRVWGKSVVQGEVKSYDETMRVLEREEAKRLKRKLTTLDTARLFPQAVNQAVKEITIQYELTCEEKEFYIYEANSYDSTGAKMTRQLNMDMANWVPIQARSVMEELFKKVCQ
jgi:hypothetical protein